MFDASSPLISLIIPCYNHGRYLRTAIDSVLAQTYPNVEIIVVDDGSSDDTSDVARSYGDKVVLIRQDNSGLAASRNAGIMRAKGEIISLMDADDTMDPDCLADRARLMVGHPEVGIAAGALRMTDEHLVPYKNEPDPIWRNRKVTKRTAFHYAMSPNIGLLVRKRAYELCGYYDPFLKACEDWDLQIRVTRKFEHRFSHNVTCNYRQVPTSMSRDTIIMFDNGLRVLRKNLIFTERPWQTRWDCLVGLYNHVLGAVFYYILTEVKGGAKVRAFMRLMTKRPITIPIFFVIACRFLKNRALKLIGLGPKARR